MNAHADLQTLAGHVRNKELFSAMQEVKGHGGDLSGMVFPYIVIEEKAGKHVTCLLRSVHGYVNSKRNLGRIVLIIRPYKAHPNPYAQKKNCSESYFVNEVCLLVTELLRI